MSRAAEAAAALGDDGAAPLALLERLAAEAEEAARRDPQANPLGILAHAVDQRVGDGALDAVALDAATRRLTVLALADRADGLARALGPIDPQDWARGPAARLTAALAPAAERGWAAFRALVESTAWGVVLTAHPTFTLDRPLAQTVVDLAVGVDGAGAALDEAARRRRWAEAARLPHGPPPAISIEDERAWAEDAARGALDAVDRARRAALDLARARFPDRWTELTPRLAEIATWVGFDQDGRADLGWQGGLRMHLQLKRAGLDRLRAAARNLVGRAGPAADAILAHLVSVADLAAAATAETVARLADDLAEPARLQAAGRRLVDGAEASLTDAGRLDALLAQALAAAEGPEADAVRVEIILLRAHLAAHGLCLARIHVRLNASQLHNAVRPLIGLGPDPEDPRARRTWLARMSELIAAAPRHTSNLGALAAESASAPRAFMQIAQALRHVDGGAPIRLLIAETESPLTLLAALYFARLFGVDRKVEISPLFETGRGIERGAAILGEALRAEPFNEHVRAQGRICVQFGFSDSGRYLGQMAATFAIERLRRRLVDAVRRHGLGHLGLTLFSTHGESVGRGGHPGSYADRFRYLCPPVARAEQAAAGIQTVEETSLQGGDGFLPLLNPAAAWAMVAQTLEAALAPDPEAVDDPIYDAPDFAAEFFAATRQFVETMVADPDYAALLGAFALNLLTRTGSRPARREAEGWQAPAPLAHPAQLRAIPNNAALQQMGLLANTLGGLGAAAGRDAETFSDLRARSPRFRRALALAERALALSDADAFRAYVDAYDPDLWLAASAHADLRANRAEPRAVAAALDRRGLHPPLAKARRRLLADLLAFQDALEAAGAAPVAADPALRRLTLTHGLRLGLMRRIFRLAVAVPDFSPRHEVGRDDLVARLLQLDVPASVDLLRRIFPKSAPEQAGRAEGDYGEPSSYWPADAQAYGGMHETLLEPLADLHALCRRLGVAISLSCGAVG